ncbi:integrin alpha-PS3-like [Aricia agestis]|uniref:integrin alpha-PS3-like n=1 Tax=Aricia agestis TaxID=91739 RepID=UPI001C209220|nr:integrin alpha-PS3-like [Aricia agestis]
MWGWKVILFVTISMSVNGLEVYHLSSGTMFFPDDSSEHFGYTVVLRPNALIVGAPKAKSRLDGLKNISSGQVFICSLKDLVTKKIACLPLGEQKMERDPDFQKLRRENFLRNDMWFGGTVAVVPQNMLLVCAPRWAVPHSDTHLLANGACFIQSRSQHQLLKPLSQFGLQAYVCDGSRKEYREYKNQNINYYAYAQAGFSLKVTNTTILMGAPGLLQWTGGVIEYEYSPGMFHFERRPVVNPYNVADLGPDDYFGYSVEAGVFGSDGSTLYVAGAPRSSSGYGLVLIFKISTKTTDTNFHVKARIRGKQLGSYFGASLLCTDVNGDGVTDLLVGAPNFVTKNGGLPYDQGAVFVYITKQQGSNFTMKFSGYVYGSGESGARFGTAMADIGDVDNDGYNDIAIGSPWENSGRGAVYIYKGSPTGLKAQFIQKVTVADARSFGISVSKAFDIDNNNCSDLAVGAHNSRSAYVFRCVPTVHVDISIKVPDAMNLQDKVSNFTAQFCVKAAKSRRTSNAAELRAKILIDPEGNRANVLEDSEYDVTIHPGMENCEERTVEVTPTADLSRPITMSFKVESIETYENSTKFPQHIARLSDESTLHSSFDIQLMRGCGEDLICRPLLQMTLSPLDTPYIPGTNQKFGVKVTVINTEEPAFGAKVQIKLPASIKREPTGCSLEGDGPEKNLTCTLPAPLYKNVTVEWEIELEYTQETDEVLIEAVLDEPFFDGDEKHKANVSIPITPKANFFISGKALPNATVTISRDKLKGGENLTFLHYFEVTNIGPSYWLHLPAEVLLSNEVHLSTTIRGCSNRTNLVCMWEVPAKTSMPLKLPLRINFKEHGIEQLFGEILEHNITTVLTLYHEGKTINQTIVTTFILEPSQPIWPIIVGCMSGLLLLAIIVLVLHRCGFFFRKRFNNEMNDTQDELLPAEESTPSGSAGLADAFRETNTNNCSTEMLLDDSD